MPYLANQENSNNQDDNLAEQYRQNMTAYGSQQLAPNTSVAGPQEWSYQGTTPGGTTASGGLGAGPNGQFVNFEQFMNANQGAAQNTNQGLLTDLTNQAQNAQGEVAGAQKQFSQDVNAPGNVGYKTTSVAGTPGTPGADPNAAAKSLGMTGTWYGAHDANQAYGDMGSGMSEQQREQITNYMNANPGTPGTPGYQSGSLQYTGPQSMATDPNVNSAQIQQDLGNAAGGIAATKTQGGLQGLLQSKYGSNGDYGAGDSAFDAALSGAYGGNQFSQLQNRYANLGSAFTKAEGGDQGVINSAEQAYSPNPPAQAATPAGTPPAQAPDNTTDENNPNKPRKHGGK